MLRGLLGFAALIGLSYLMADKSKIPEYQRQLDRIMWPWAIGAVLLLGLILFSG